MNDETPSYFNEDAVLACADLVGRAGAREFEIGYIHEDVPIDQAGWYAVALYRGTRVTADDHKSPSLAANALAERLLRGATCRCGRRVSLGNATGSKVCWWRLAGPKWEPGCDAKPIRIKGERGDVAALERAMAERLRGES